MTEQPPVLEELPADPVLPLVGGPVVKFAFVPRTQNEMRGVAWCKHGEATSAIYTNGTVNPSAMVEQVYRNHQLLVPGCDCPRDAPKLNATVTFSPAAGVEPGQQRYIPQASGMIEPPRKNLWWGPGLTCAKAGAYQIVAKVQLAKGLSAGARGLGVVIVQGVPVVSVAMLDEGGKATANISAMLNLAPNQSVAVGYENTSTATQDVSTTTLTVSEVWLP